MKISHLLLSLVSLSLTVISARADSADTKNDCVQLPAYTVEVARQTAAERQIASNLAELRAAAQVPLAVTVEIPLLAAQVGPRPEASQPAPVLVVAGN
jgi:hypothetical protein